MSCIESSSPTLLKKLSQLKVACILDEFSANCFKYECNLIAFRPDNWKETLTKEKPDMLLVESAWAGNDNSWQFKIAKYNVQNKSELIELARWCNALNIPTVFWNKEDPFHFERFIESAGLFDYVFTTDQNMVSRYIKALNHKNVYVMQFAAQPKIHNPVIAIRRKDRLCFAGSYYEDRHEERRNDLEMLLDAAVPYGLDIFDRNYEKTKQKNMPFSFPERFQPFIQQGSLKYNEIDTAYKGYKILLNVNSIKNSPTMFSRRVFEVMASGSPIVSNYSEGIEKTFGNEIVLMGKSKAEYQEIIKLLLHDQKFYDKIRIAGLRWVLSKHTYAHRLLDMASITNIGLAADYESEVCIICFVNNEYQAEMVIENFNRQCYKNKELIFFTADNKLIDPIMQILSNQGIEEHLYNFILEDEVNNLNNITDVCSGRYIGCFSAENYYCENFLLDLMYGTKYSHCRIIGKSSYFSYDQREQCLKLKNPLNEYTHTSDIEFTACIMDISVLKDIQLKTIYNSLKNTNGLGCCIKTEEMLSLDKYNFLKYSNLCPEGSLKDIVSQISI